jgi:serine/threonine protein kinase
MPKQTSIVKLLDHDVPNLRLELEYGGRDLHKFANNQKMSQISESTAYQVWMDISSGLEYIHSQDIIHLDIKLGNILLGNDGRAKICDFGHSLQGVVKPIRSSIGTHTYIPPEFIGHSL